MTTKRSGTSRNSRLVSSLNPDNIKIDNRSLTDLLAYTKEVATLINFYGEDNEIQGNWGQFFQKNNSFFMAEIVNKDITTLYKKGSNLLLKYHFSKKGNDNKKASYLLLLIGIIDEYYSIITNWQKRVNEVSELGNYIEIHLKIKYCKERYFDKQRSHLTTVKRFLDEKTNTTNPNKILKHDTPSTEQNNPLLSVQFVYDELKGIFNTFYEQLNYLKQIAENDLKIAYSEKSDHEPLMGLLIAFLKIFRFQQDHLNKFTGKHLEYYYHQVLGQKNKNAIPDRTHASFTLKKESLPYLVPKGTLLLADINDDGLESHYETLHDTLVSRAEITSLQTLNISRNSDFNFESSFNTVSNIYHAPIANSKDGLGTPFNETNKSWPIVGEDQSLLSQRQKNMMTGNVGLAIVAPILYLEAGSRKITLDLKVDPDTQDNLFVLLKDLAQSQNQTVAIVFETLLRSSIEIFGTTTEGWFKIEDYNTKPIGQWGDNSICIDLMLGNEMPPLVPLGKEAEGNRYSEKWPAIKIMLRSGTSIYAYSFLQVLKMRRIEIKVDVQNLKKLTLTNIAGQFNNNTPFPLFGALPDKNSELLIGSRELFLKNITSLGIDIEWNNLPDLEGGFDKYYDAYISNESGESLGIGNDSFKMKISALSQAQFFPNNFKDQQILPLFQMDENNRLSTITKIQKTIETKKLLLNANLDEPIELLPYANDTQLGYIRLTMCEPKFAFGHIPYPRILAHAVTHNTFASAKKAWWKNQKTKLIPLPNEPFTPVVKRISINYTAKSSINIIGQGGERKPDEIESQIIRIIPFGYKTIFKNGISDSRELLEPFGSDGYLVIGLNNIKPGLPLNLMFEFSGSKNKTMETPVNIRWFYLSDNTFYQFKKEDIYYDTTSNFTSNGIVSLRIPEDINKNNTIIQGDHYWILVAARGKITKVLGKIIQIKTHAVEARWVNNNDPNHYSNLENLPKIKALAKKKSAIASVEQVGPFFGGHPKESKKLLWTRVSERLRHKGRAVNLWDFERLVIQEFPEVRQVKCIGPGENGGDIISGEVIVAVVSEHIGKNNLRPTIGVNLLRNIHEYLQNLTSPHVDLNIINPSYEWLKLSMQVLLKAPFQNQTGKYLKQLSDEIENFICPWLHQGDIRIGGGFKKKDLHNYIQSRPYIEYVTSFSIVHIFEKEIKENGKVKKLSEKLYEFNLLDSAKSIDQRDEISANSSYGILVPADIHNIQFIKDSQFIKPKETSLSKMALETDMLILDPKEEPSKKVYTKSSAQSDFFSILNLD